jgi:hypothetical protein
MRLLNFPFSLVGTSLPFTRCNQIARHAEQQLPLKTPHKTAISSFPHHSTPPLPRIPEAGPGPIPPRSSTPLPVGRRLAGHGGARPFHRRLRAFGPVSNVWECALECAWEGGAGPASARRRPAYRDQSPDQSPPGPHRRPRLVAQLVPARSASRRLEFQATHPSTQITPLHPVFPGASLGV